jgi:hypothetical protein
MGVCSSPETAALPKGNSRSRAAIPLIRLPCRIPGSTALAWPPRGTYHTDGHTLEVPDLTAQALGGTITGRLELVLKGLAFRVDTHAQGVDLATVLAAVANESFPVTPLHWDSSMDVQATNTWTADFKQFESRGVSLWTAPAALRPGLIPATAQIHYHYSALANGVTLEPSEISTPSSRVQFRGSLGAGDNSDLEATFDTRDLLLWDDFIDAIRGKNAEHKVIAGQFNWQGRLTGPIVAPTFAGHVKGSNARYDRLYWDDLEGDMTYSPDGFDFVRARASRGSSSAQIELSLTLDDWAFLPESPWSFDVSLVRTDSDGLQSLLGTSYPVHGMVTGTFHAKGTRANTNLIGLVDVISPEAWGWRLDRAPWRDCDWRRPSPHLECRAPLVALRPIVAAARQLRRRVCSRATSRIALTTASLRLT